MKELYLFLSSTKTYVARTVYLFTRSKITHSAICLNGKFDHMYSFGRKTLKLFPAGYVYENIRERMLKKQNRCFCKVFRIKISDEAYENMLKEIEKYEAEKEKYKYAIFGALLCALRIEKTIKYKRFCSQFVANILHDGAGVELPFNTSLMRPKDYLKIPNLEQVYDGTIKDLEKGIDSGKLNFKTIEN